MDKLPSSVLNQLKSTSRKKMEVAFNIIYDYYSYLVFYVSLQIVKDNETAKDITNETFMNFYTHKDQINKNKNIKYYLVTTAKNLSLNQLKIIEKQRAINLRDIPVSQSHDHFNDYIEKFKDFLNQEEIELLVFHLLYGFSFKEIGKQSSQTTNAISSKYRRILQKIKQHYKGELEHE